MGTKFAGCKLPKTSGLWCITLSFQLDAWRYSLAMIVYVFLTLSHRLFAKIMCMYLHMSITCSARRQDGTMGPLQWYEFTTSGAPTAGTCSVTPEDGFFESTDYTISCTGFADVNLPLTYTALYTDLSTSMGNMFPRLYVPVCSASTCAEKWHMLFSHFWDEIEQKANARLLC